ncbi:MAG: glycosyltransferase family 2 protein [Chloroherpetonaceae bacterium]|nr:glycosyltransferase family 2 protein [Chloroherpetonaceae bacterium]
MKISVLTVTYNAEKYIQGCLENVIAQSCRNIEHIIADGGSKDRTVEIIKSFSEKYPHIKWISEKDKGQSDAMNKTLQMASGEVISFLNVDDFYEPNVLNFVLDEFETLPEPSLLVGWCNIIGNSSELIKINKPARLNFIDLVSEHYKTAFPLNPSAYFYHKSLHSIIGNFDINEHYHMDYDFILKAVRVANVKSVEKVLGNLRMVDGAKTYESLKAGEHIERHQKFFNRWRNSLPEPQRSWVKMKHKMLNSTEYFMEHPAEILPKIKARFIKDAHS